MAFTLQTRDCGLHMTIVPLEGGLMEFSISSKESFTILLVDTYEGPGLSAMLGALYHFLPNGDREDKEQYIDRKYVLFNEHRGVKKIVDQDAVKDPKKIDRRAFYVERPWRAQFTWKCWEDQKGGKPATASWTLERPYDDSTDFSVKVTLTAHDCIEQSTKTLTFTLPYEDLCYVVADACTQALKMCGVMGYHFSLEHEDINLRHLLYVKAIALGVQEMCQLTDDKHSHGFIHTYFDDELRLLYFDMHPKGDEQ